MTKEVEDALRHIKDGTSISLRADAETVAAALRESEATLKAVQDSYTRIFNMGEAAEQGWAKTLEDFAGVEKELAEAKQTITARAGKVAEAVQAFRKVYVAAWHLCDATEDCSATEELGGVPIVKTEEAKYAALEDALDETEKLYDRWFPSISPALKSEAKEPKP